ncbi:MAG: ABC transporter substrate-binding protein [Chloroflexota bacterium]
MEQGAWDGDCATWQDWYSPGVENSKLTNIINGTGPYMLDHWTPGEEWVLTAYEDYWRTAETRAGKVVPMVRHLSRPLSIVSSTSGVHAAMMQSGDVEWVVVNPEDEVQVDPLVGTICDAQTFECEPNPDNPTGQFVKYVNRPSVGQIADALTFNIPPDSPYRQRPVGW